VLAAGLVAGSLAASSTDHRGFSVPVLVIAAVVALAWLVVMGAAALARRPPHVHAEPATQDLPPESPAVAGMLCDDFELRSEFVPATLLDLAARRVVRLEEVQPGRTICRVRDAPSADGLSAYERRVLDEVRAKAVEGVVPTEALTTGTEDVSRAWRRAYAKEVAAESHDHGLTLDRWPAGLIAVLALGPLVVGGLLYLAVWIGGDTSGDRAVVAGVAAAVAVVALLVMLGFAGRWGHSLAQLPTPAGRDEASRCLGLRAHLRENENFDDLPPAAVELWGRHFAYAAAMGVAREAVRQLPMGAEDDHRAWSRVGGRWRRVEVRYPRARPPAWGKHPAFSLSLGLLWGAVATGAIYGLHRVAAEAAKPGGLAPTLTRDQLDWVGRGALILILPFAFLLVWCLWVLVRAVPDLFLQREVTGDIVRARERAQVFGTEGRTPKYWYYLAVDDGTTRRLRAWRVRQELYRAHSQGETVTGVVTPNLSYVRELRGAR
jgi:hypothetical protein